MRNQADALAALERARRERPSEGAVLRAMGFFARSLPRDPPALARLHEALLFHAAYPESAAVRPRAAAILRRMPDRVRNLAERGVDLSVLDHPELAGIGGTEIATTFTYDFLRGLASRHPGSVRVDWDAFEGEDRLGAALSRLVPLVAEEALADANVPYRQWIDAARRGRPELSWLLDRFESLPLPASERAALFDGVTLPVAWELSAAASRTAVRPLSRPFRHAAPLLSRREVDLRAELASPPLPVRRLGRREAARRIDMARDANGCRYRELYGFTYGDPETARSADAGRGCEIFLFGLPPDRRLPLRAGYSAFVVKNGVPVAYVEGLALFERMEVGFNVYYTFREGESAWIYARVLKLFHEVLGVSSFSIDPYQIGFDNEEAIASGAFWFYRKLGFRSSSSFLRDLTTTEESRLARNAARRTPAATLRRLARRNILFDARNESAGAEWEGFHIRRIGLAVNRRLAGRDASAATGGAAASRRAAASRVARQLGLPASPPRAEARRALEDLALVIEAGGGTGTWSPDEKRLAARVVRAKTARDEDGYLRLMRRHAKLRRAMLRLGRGAEDAGGD
ncbi:MAG: hypothetical protein ABI592_13065 [Acidobacteriota bacterium]